MGKLSSLLYGAGAGAALMYFMDKDLGNRRRALVRDRAASLRFQADDAIETAVRDLRNRARGILAEGMATVSNEDLNVNDQILSERIRARMGFLARHPRAVDVMVQDRVAILSGDALAPEVEGLLRGVGKVRGIQRVENRIRVHETAGDIPQLQGEGRMPGDNQSSRRWTPTGRLLAGTGAGYLFLYGMMRGGFLGTISQLSGMLLGLRAIGNLDLRRMAGMRAAGDAVRVRKTINIQAPVDEVYELWSNFENFPRFMSNIEQIQDLGDGRSHWVVKGPAGSKVEFDAVMTENKRNEMIAWETVAESQVKHHGQVRFKQGEREGTQVNVNMAYTPPAGVVGHAVANVFGVDPKSAMDHDLMRLKSLLEAGKTGESGQKGTRGQVPVTGQRRSRASQMEEMGGMQQPPRIDDEMDEMPDVADQDMDNPLVNSE